MNDRCVGSTLLRRCHHLDLQGISQPADDLLRDDPGTTFTLSLAIVSVAHEGSSPFVLSSS